MSGLSIQLRQALLRRFRVLGDRRIALADKSGMREDGADVLHLPVGQSALSLQLSKQLFVQLQQGRPIRNGCR